MTFCREFKIPPLDAPEQPADVVFRWQRYAVLEGEEAKRRQLLADFHAGRKH